MNLQFQKRWLASKAKKGKQKKEGKSIVAPLKTNCYGLMWASVDKSEEMDLSVETQTKMQQLIF